jgi:AcrR family transcriptional regulator
LHTTQLDEPFLEAAARVIAERGIERATLERIASEAGLSRVTLHRRGITKEAILAALYERWA